MSSGFRIREDKCGGYHVTVDRLSMNADQPCKTIDELDEMIRELHLDGLLNVDDVVSLRRQLERIEHALRISKQRQALFHLGRQKHVSTGQ